MKNRFQIKLIYLLVIICGLGSRLAFGSESKVSLVSSPLSLDRVLAEVHRENPEIKAAWERWQAFKARISQAATPSKPRLDIERMYAPRGKNVWSDAEEKNLVLSQDIPFPTALYYAGRRARQEAEEAETAYRAKELDVISRARQAYALLFLSRHAIHMFEENVDLMRQFSVVAEAKYAAGKASQSDVLKAQVELSKMLNELVTLQQEKETNEAMLNTLLNRPPESPLGFPMDPPPPKMMMTLAELETLALEARPELQGAAIAVDKRHTQVALGRSDYFPDIMLQYRRRNMSAGIDSHDAMVGFTLPLWFWKQGAMVREARAERDMAQAEYQSLKSMTLFDVKSLFVKVQTAQRLIELYQTSVLPQAEHALKISEASYRADKMSFLDLLDAARSLLQFRLEHYGHFAQYDQFKAELEQVVGIPLIAKESEQ